MSSYTLRFFLLPSLVIKSSAWTGHNVSVPLSFILTLLPLKITLPLQAYSLTLFIHNFLRFFQMQQPPEASCPCQFQCLTVYQRRNFTVSIPYSVTGLTICAILNSYSWILFYQSIILLQTFRSLRYHRLTATKMITIQSVYPATFRCNAHAYESMLC